MKILHLLGDRKLPFNPDEDAASGVVRVALDLAREQVKRDHNVTIATVSGTARKGTWEGVNLVGLPHLPWAKAHFAGRIIDYSIHLPYVLYTHRQRFDVVQGHLYSYLRFLRAEMKLIHVHTDPGHLKTGTHNTALSPLDGKIITKTTNYQVGVSHFVASQLAKVLNSDSNIRVIHNGADTNRFNSDKYQDERANLRSQWGVREGEVVFLYSGAIVSEKGVIHLARAFSELLKDRPRLHLVLAGSSTLWGSNFNQVSSQSEYEREVMQQLGEARVCGVAHFLGKVSASEMPQTYAAADVLVVPSVWQEPFPLNISEAMASGLPIVASRAGGIPEIVNDTNGILIPAGDEKVIQLALQKMAGDPAIRKRLGQGGVETAKRFSWSSVADKFEDLYRAAIEGGDLL